MNMEYINWEWWLSERKKKNGIKWNSLIYFNGWIRERRKCIEVNENVKENIEIEVRNLKEEVGS